MMPAKQQTVERELEKLRKKIMKGVPARRMEENLLIATWNIRNFGARKSARAIRYIAEICSHFDIVAIQEVKDSLKGLQRLQQELGPDYRFVFTDPAGNNERLVFLYDRRRAAFSGLAAEIVLDPGDKEAPTIQFHRTPYTVSFRTAYFDFVMVTVHIYYGSGRKKRFREKEITDLAKFVEKRASDQDIYDPDIIVLGDFNIAKVGDRYFKALQSGGLIVPEEIRKLRTNFKHNKHYDQIAFYRYPDSAATFSGRAGVIDFTTVVFKDLSKRKMSYALSDHLPLWAEFLVVPEREGRMQALNP